MRRFVIFMVALSLSPLSAAQSVIAKNAMISAANPFAVKAGLSILKKGGSAIDAAIAAQMVLNVVEPQSSGIGGGAFLLHWQASNQTLTTFDGRETAPAAADEKLFTLDGTTMKWQDAVVGGRAVGVPGLLAMLYMAHQKHGKLPWASLFAPAIEIAENGFEVSARLSASIARAAKNGLGRYPAAKQYFFTDDGAPLPVGYKLQNRRFAQTLRNIADNGIAAFYEGDIARRIVAATRDAKDNPGVLSLQDLQNYRAKMRPPICRPYRQYKVCGMGPPTSGGLTVLQILGTLENFDMAALSPLSSSAAHLFTQAARLSYADRAAHIADSDFHPTPIAPLLNADYLKSRARTIDPNADMKKAQTGFTANAISAKSFELPSTTHLSIVDQDGNAASMTSSIENAFGSTLMVDGFLLNNQLTDFSFAAKNQDGLLIANRAQANKRPRSSMSPTIVFTSHNGKDAPYLIIGSPGGSRIINYVARSIIAVLDWNLDVQAALNLPHYVNRNGATDLEADTKAVMLKENLENIGHQVNVRPLVSGLHAIHIINNTLHGGADPRREGIAAGY